MKLELPEGEQSVTRYLIDEEHCNPKKVWEQMGSPMDMTPAQIEEIKEKSKLIPETVEIETAESVLQLRGSLGVNDVHCYVKSSLPEIEKSGEETTPFR